MFDRNRFENSRGDGYPVLEVVSEQDSREATRRFVPLKRTELTGEIAGPLADLQLVQTFGYSREECDRTLEAIYRFPLPGDAAVRGVTVRFGDVEIAAELKEREQAEVEYQTAKQRGQQAALATRESPDVFTLRVAGLNPDEEIVVETAYVQLAQQDSAAWSLRVPLTTAPRYVRQDETGSRHANGQPLAILRDPGHRFALDLQIRNAEHIRSSTHTLSVTSYEGDGVQRVRLEAGEVVPDRDCVLTWQTARQEQNPALYVLLHDDASDDNVYFLAQLAPPAQRPNREPVPREIILLVDHSGSMEGAKWAASDWAVKGFLSNLTAQDRVGLGLFHSTTRWHSRKLRPGDAGTIQNAITFLETHKDSGGTELGVALEQALSLPRENGKDDASGRSRHLLIVTDAEVSDAGRVLRLAEEETKEKQARRISVLCIDAAPNALLARELAERGGGVAKFLTSDPEQEDITTALDSILDDWAAPILTGLRLEVSRASVSAVGRNGVPSSKPGGSAIDVGDLPAGRAVWIAGRVPRGDSPDLAFRVVTETGTEIAASRRDLNNPDHVHPAIKALFGARQVLGLEYLQNAYYDRDGLRESLIRMGYDADAILSGSQSGKGKKLYAENQGEDSRAALKSLLVRESLNYGLASAETAFVAVRKEAGKPVEGTAIVANALPAGWSEGFVGAAMAAPAGGAAPAAYAARAMMLSAPSSAPAAPTMDWMMRDISAPAATRRSRGLFKRSQSPAPMSKPVAPPPIGFAVAEEDDVEYEADLDQMTRAGAGAVFETLPATVDDLKAAHSARNAPTFTGKPTFTNGEAVLFDNTRTEDANCLPASGLLTELAIRMDDAAKSGNVDSGLVLLLYVDDLTTPRARVRLADLVRQGGTRPLNIQYRAGHAIRLVLADANGVWAANAPELRVVLR